ncbi:rod shape-determining protein [Lasius niger]|uniref:Rod shape-determining protein n=1 Tax=Lasius niger TaxID=67767 RepID=A0A0J7N0V1_LASNI|nr:rod shape-determining protein [Lasius niger]
MDKTNLEKTTPGGTPGKLENPSSTEVGPMDSGGGQLLLKNLASRIPSEIPSYKEENEKLRLKISEIELLCEELRNEISILRSENKELKKAYNINRTSHRKKKCH